MGSTTSIAVSPTVDSPAEGRRLHPVDAVPAPSTGASPARTVSVAERRDAEPHASDGVPSSSSIPVAADAQTATPPRRELSGARQRGRELAVRLFRQAIADCTLGQLAQWLGVSRQYVTKMRDGEVPIQLGDVLAIAHGVDERLAEQVRTLAAGRRLDREHPTPQQALADGLAHVVNAARELAHAGALTREETAHAIYELDRASGEFTQAKLALMEGANQGGR